MPSEAQSLSANQISSTYLNWRLRYNYFRFWKTNVRHIGNLLFGFDFDHLLEICTLFCITIPNFVQIKAPTAEVWRHIHFWRWRPRRLNTTSVSYLLMSLPSEGQSLLADQILSRYLKWRLRYNYFRFRNTNVRHIGILLLISISTSSP